MSPAGLSHARHLALFNRGNPATLPAFKIHVAPIATGAAVVEDAGVFPRLSHSMRKVLGIDMESSALAALAEAHGVPVLIAKAASDFGDRFKDDRYRTFAARASAECLLQLLRTGPAFD